MPDVSAEELLRIIDKLPQTRIAIVGDLVLDRFIYGISTRISREAPVLILKELRREQAPGGGANTIHNCLTLDIDTYALSVLGKDDAGGELLELLEKGGLKKENSFLPTLDNYATTCKTRILGGLGHSMPQQIVRVDTEQFLTLSREYADKIVRKLHEFLPALDAVIVADYGLGVVSDYLISKLKKLIERSGIKIIVDSRFAMLKFAGFYSITPNITEVEDALKIPPITDLRELESIGKKVLEELRLNSLLITRGKFGMSLVEQNSISHIPCFGSDEVADVTGAGDTVISVFTAALATGANTLTAAVLSNIAGGLVVQKQGTATLTRDELRAGIANWQSN